MKTSGRNRSQPLLKLLRYGKDPALCVASAVEAFILRTRELRGDAVSLFVSWKRPYKPVSSQTLSRWIKTVLKRSGLDTTIFFGLQYPSRIDVGGKKSGISIDVIRKTAGWTPQSQTFAKFMIEVS